MSDEKINPNDAIVSRRTTLTLAAGVAALGLALGMRSNAFAQGKMEGKGEGKFEGKGDGKFEGKGEGKYEGKGEGKYEGKGEGKFDGKEGRREGKGGRIKLDVDADGATAVDVKCAENESMQTCADLTKEILDRVRRIPAK